MRVLRPAAKPLLAIFICGVAGALTAAPPVTDADELFVRLDQDGDGRIEASEIGPAHARLFRLLLATSDADQDGALSHEELAAGLKDKRPQRPLERLPDPPTPPEVARAMFRRYDTDRNNRLELKELPLRQQPVFRKLLGANDKNKDGALDFQEFEGSYAQLMEEPAAMLEGDGGSTDAAKLLKRLMQLDENGDGKIDREEARGPVKARFEKLDADANGVLDQAELKRAAERFSKAVAKENPNVELKARLKRLEDKLKTSAGAR